MLLTFLRNIQNPYQLQSLYIKMTTNTDPSPDPPRTILISNIPQTVNKREIETLFGELGPLKRCFIQYPRNDTTPSTTLAYVTYALPEDASAALVKLANHKLGDNKLVLKFAKSRSEQERENVVKYKGVKYQENQPSAPRTQPRAKQVKKKARVIVRNLAFQATESSLSKHFSPYGTIKEINLLKKPNGKLVGCAFIQFGSANQAAKVVKELNLKPFMGRPIAIDWALPKNKFQESDKVKEEVQDVKVEDNADSKDEIKIKIEPEDEDLGFSSSVKFNLKGTTAKKRKKVERDDEDSASDSDCSDSNTSDPPSKPKLQKLAINPNDADEGLTLFIRNLDFDITSNALKEFFEQFGPVNYAVLCKDKLTEHPKGTAFVKFRHNDSLKSCLEKSELEPSHFQLGHRQFYVSVAMSKGKLTEKLDTKNDKNEIKSDKRNLYLAREGFLRPGTPAAASLSTSDLNKRLSLYQHKKQMLRDLKIFVSDKRLCIHNLPSNYTDKKLRKLALEHGGSGAKVVESRVMRNLSDLDSNGVGKSKEFGFVTFTQHEHALAALRSLNNNPEIFSKNKRPIVEFSLENMAALRAKEKRTEKSLIKLKGSGDSDDKDVKVKSTSKKVKPENEDTPPPFTGLTAKPGISTLPSLKPKGKISRNNLKVGLKMKKKKKLMERRKREPKMRPKVGRSGEDKVDEIVKKYKERSGDSGKNADGKNRKKKGKKWFD